MPAPRADYPVLRANPRLAYLDHAATGLMHDDVIQAITHAYAQGGSAGRAGHRLGHAASRAYEAARAAVATWLGAPAHQVVFTGSATDGVLLLSQGWAAQHLLPGDRIVVTALDHHANLLPWQAVARQTGARLDVVALDARGELDLQDLDRHLALRPRLVAFPHVSNVTGGITPLAEVVHRVRVACPHARVVVDGSQAVAHLRPDPSWRLADAYVFSGHKLGGPAGIGVVWGTASLWDDTHPVRWGGGMVHEAHTRGHTLTDAPWRFEGGTPNHAAAVGLAAALPHALPPDDALTEALVQGLHAQHHVQLVGQPTRRAGVVSFVVQDHHPHDVAGHLDALDIAVRAGHLCAQPAVRAFGHTTVVRASLGPTTVPEDIARLLSGLHDLAGYRP